MYLKINSDSTTKQYTLTNNYNKPYLKVSNSILPLTTQDKTGLKLKVRIDNQTYRAMEYLNSSTSATYKTSSLSPGEMSSTTALTESVSISADTTITSTTGTSYETAPMASTGNMYVHYNKSSTTLYGYNSDNSYSNYSFIQSVTESYSSLSDHTTSSSISSDQYGRAYLESFESKLTFTTTERSGATVNTTLTSNYGTTISGFTSYSKSNTTHTLSSLTLDAGNNSLCSITYSTSDVKNKADTISTFVTKNHTITCDYFDITSSTASRSMVHYLSEPYINPEVTSILWVSRTAPADYAITEYTYPVYGGISSIYSSSSYYGGNVSNTGKTTYKTSISRSITGPIYISNSSVQGIYTTITNDNAYLSSVSVSYSIMRDDVTIQNQSMTVRYTNAWQTYYKTTSKYDVWYKDVSPNYFYKTIMSYSSVNIVDGGYGVISYFDISSSSISTETVTESNKTYIRYSISMSGDGEYQSSWFTTTSSYIPIQTMVYTSIRDSTYSTFTSTAVVRQLNYTHTSLSTRSSFVNGKSYIGKTALFDVTYSYHEYQFTSNFETDTTSRIQYYSTMTFLGQTFDTYNYYGRMFASEYYENYCFPFVILNKINNFVHIDIPDLYGYSLINDTLSVVDYYNFHTYYEYGRIFSLSKVNYSGSTETTKSIPQTMTVASTSSTSAKSTTAYSGVSSSSSSTSAWQ